MISSGYNSQVPRQYIAAKHLSDCQVGNMRQTRPYQDLKTYSIDTPMPLKNEEPMDEDISPGPSSLPKDSAVVPFPTPNMDMASILNPTPQLPRRSCNKAYTLEQIHFIQYYKEDLKLSWPETQARFKEKFPDPARDVSMVGLQCRYYRAQRYPMLDIEGSPVLNDDGMIIMRDITVRERGQKGGLKVPILDDQRRPMYHGKGRILMRELNEEELHGPIGRNLRMIYQKYFKLVDRVPEYAEKYGWIRNEHKTLAKRNGMPQPSSSLFRY